MTAAVSGHGNTAHSAAQPLRLWFGLPVAITQASAVAPKDDSRLFTWDEAQETKKFMPTRSELLLMFSSRELLNLSTGHDDWYWSSPENTSNAAWIQRFSDGGQLEVGLKNDSHRVRCVRRIEK